MRVEDGIPDVAGNRAVFVPSHILRISGGYIHIAVGSGAYGE